MLACRQAGDWLRAGMPLRVAVNLSAQQLRQADLQQRLMASLARHGVPPHLLELEVTESAAMTDPLQARELLGSLLAAGVCVVLDDFGTGYSSLAHLRDLPVSRVKIDRTFIGPMLDSPADAKIVKAVIALARTLGLQVVAEGVENRRAAAPAAHPGLRRLPGLALRPRDAGRADPRADSQARGDLAGAAGGRGKRRLSIKLRTVATGRQRW
jgi:EAL domain-containing protein (putative c-di-GMP-specific phosphodiesterase class I)